MDSKALKGMGKWGLSFDNHRARHDRHGERRPLMNARIFTACHGTQLLVIQHLRRHLKRPAAREFLVWHPMGNDVFIDSFMREVIETAGFDNVLDIRHLRSFRPRTTGSLLWLFDSARRLQADAKTVRAWIEMNGIAEKDCELWTDEPLHFHVQFLRALLKDAEHVKFPHSFNQEDESAAGFKRRMNGASKEAGMGKKFVFFPMQRWLTGVDFRIQQKEWSRAYTFDRPSPWSGHSIDVSNLITLPAFDETYQDLAPSIRSAAESLLASLASARRPLVLLLMFGLDAQSRQLYEQGVGRIFAERADELRGCTLAVKAHPGHLGADDEAFLTWVQNNISANVVPIRHALNLEFILARLKPDYVCAGPSGVIPIVRRLKVGQPVVIREILDVWRASETLREYLCVVDGVQVW